MKSFIAFGAFAATGLAQTAQFTNTSFTGPFAEGQTIPLMWTIGNGSPMSLSVANSTWSHQIFVDRAVLPTTYEWVVTALPGFVSGNYQLALEQTNGGVSNSPVFAVIVSEMANTTTMTTSAPIVTATVTYVYWDDHCGCTKTGTVAAPLNTSMPVTTTKWWDEQCGCHQSAVIPLATIPAANNYTVPAVPPVPSPMTTAPAPTVAKTSLATAGTSTPATFKGEAVKIESSLLGMMALVAAMAIV